MALNDRDWRPGNPVYDDLYFEARNKGDHVMVHHNDRYDDEEIREIIQCEVENAVLGFKNAFSVVTSGEEDDIINNAVNNIYVLLKSEECPNKKQ